MTTVYVLDNLSNISTEQLSESLDSLPEWRRQLALRFKHEQGRKECTFSYMLLCKALKHQYGIDAQPHFCYGEHGKPVLAEHPGIHFNISHCKTAVACALSDAEVGIDIEMLGRYKESLARYAMNEKELAQIQASPVPDTEFTRLWTQKEAVFKLTGSGINGDVKNILSNDIYVRTYDDISDSYMLSVAQYEKKPLKILQF